MKKIIKVTNPIDKLDTIKKGKFVDLYRETRGHISDCCRAVNIARQTYYNWLESDSNFLQLIAEAEAEINDDMREALIQKGADGDTGAIIFYLKKRHPDFKDTPGLTAVQFENVSQSMKLIVTRGEDNE